MRGRNTTALRQAAGDRARAGRRSSCTTGRRTRTARSTSATPSTRCSRTSSSSRARSTASMRRTCRAGIAMACRSSTRSRRMRGRAAKQLDARAFRQACRDFALEQVDVQRADFKRLGVLGDWERPVPHAGTRATRRSSCAPSRRSSATGTCTRATSPCTGVWIAVRRWPRRRWNTRTASRRRSTCVSRRRSADLRGDSGQLRCRQARDERRDLDDDAMDAAGQPGRRACIREFAYALWLVEREDGTRALRRGRRARAMRSRGARQLDAASREAGRASGAGARGPEAAASVLRARGAGHPRRARDARQRHRCGAHGAGARPGRLRGRPAIRARRSTTPSATTAASCRSTPLFAGEQVFEANKHIVEVLAERGALLHHEAYRAQLSALLAAQDAGDLPRHAAVVHQHGAGRAARAGAGGDRARCAGRPAWGEQRIAA